jgi:hypothetical protein
MLRDGVVCVYIIIIKYFAITTFSSPQRKKCKNKLHVNVICCSSLKNVSFILKLYKNKTQTIYEIFILATHVLILALISCIIFVTLKLFSFKVTI